MTTTDLGHAPLVDRIRDEILRDGPMTFARFMELALHHPELGYYAAGPTRLGQSGDFITASDLGPAFGRALARQIDELDRCLNGPDAFDVVEFGAGRGLLARDVLAALAVSQPDLHRRLRYTAVDASAHMRREIGRVAPTVCTTQSPGVSGIGCVLAFELFDALPVHRVVRREGRLREIRVDWNGTCFEESEFEPSEDVRAWAERYGAAAEEGFEAEVGLGLEREIDRWDQSIRCGFAVVLDYGDRAERLYAPQRKRGTLMTYHDHRAGESYLKRIGQQDLTAHVNFSALTDAAQARGWGLLGATTQDRFLIANGILDEFENLDEQAYHDPRAIQDRIGIKQLIHPTGMGRMFQVYVFHKGLDEAPSIAGLADPFGR